MSYHCFFSLITNKNERKRTPKCHFWLVILLEKRSIIALTNSIFYRLGKLVECFQFLNFFSIFCGLKAFRGLDKWFKWRILMKFCREKVKLHQSRTVEVNDREKWFLSTSPLFTSFPNPCKVLQKLPSP